jgi:hypothetical protein
LISIRMLSIVILLLCLWYPRPPQSCHPPKCPRAFVLSLPLHTIPLILAIMPLNISLRHPLQCCPPNLPSTLSLSLHPHAIPVQMANLSTRGLPHYLLHCDHPIDYLTTYHSRRTQILLCVTGEGGTSKSQIPRAIEAALNILGRKHEICDQLPGQERKRRKNSI